PLPWDSGDRPAARPGAPPQPASLADESDHQQAAREDRQGEFAAGRSTPSNAIAEGGETMRPRDEWIWVALGVGGAALWLWRRRTAPEESQVPQGLALPLEGRPLRLTPHGSFGAYRKGPPAHWHQGLDLHAPPGSRVLAVGDG